MSTIIAPKPKRAIGMDMDTFLLSPSVSSEYAFGEGPYEDESDQDSIDEGAEYEGNVDLNLGAEEMESPFSEELVKADVPPRTRTWRSSSFDMKKRRMSVLRVPTKKSPTSRDCGICFEMAVNPCRTLCCGNMFCEEHLADWLHGSSSDGCCPACKAPCIPPPKYPAPSPRSSPDLSDTTVSTSSPSPSPPPLQLGFLDRVKSSHHFHPTPAQSPAPPPLSLVSIKGAGLRHHAYSDLVGRILSFLGLALAAWVLFRRGGATSEVVLVEEF